MKIFLTPFLFCSLSLLSFSNKEKAESLNSWTYTPREEKESSDPYLALDEYAMKAPKINEKNLTTLANYLLKAGPKNEQEKSRLLYAWVTTHIRYDMTSYLSGKTIDCNAESVLARKTSVCEGYSNLFQKLGEAMGLEVVKIVGYDKGYNYKEGSHLKKASHAWNAIKVDGKWQLFDATWGGGLVLDGKYVFKFDPYWFNVNPKEFIFYHLPDEEKWQLLNSPLTLKQFEKLPFTHADFFKLGFPYDTIFNAAMAGRLKKLPEAFNLKYSATMIEGPYEGILKKGQKYKFVLECKGPEILKIIDGDKFFPLNKDGNRFQIEHTPKSNILRISYKTREKDKEAFSILKYQVK